MKLGARLTCKSYRQQQGHLESAAANTMSTWGWAMARGSLPFLTPCPIWPFLIFLSCYYVGKVIVAQENQYKFNSK